MELSDLERILVDDQEKLSEQEINALYFKILRSPEVFRNAPAYLRQKKDFAIFCLHLNEGVAKYFDGNLFEDEAVLRTFVTLNPDAFFKYIPNGNERAIPRMGTYFRKRYEMQ